MPSQCRLFLQQTSGIEGVMRGGQPQPGGPEQSLCRVRPLQRRRVRDGEGLFGMAVTKDTSQEQYMWIPRRKSNSDRAALKI